MQTPAHEVRLEALRQEYDRLAEMLEAARPASDSKSDMLAATAAMRRVLDNTRLLLETVAVEAYEATTATHADMGAALGTMIKKPDRGNPMPRNNAQRWVETARRKLPVARVAEGLTARLGA
jgi:hypothetical protein